METSGLTNITFTAFLMKSLDSHLRQPGTIQPVVTYCVGASSQPRAVNAWFVPKA